MGDQKLGEATEREAVDTGAEALLDRANTALNLANMAIGRDDVHRDRADVLANTVKFIVGVDVANVEASRTVQVEGSGDFDEDGFVGVVGYGADGAETDAEGNGVEETRGRTVILYFNHTTLRRLLQ